MEIQGRIKVITPIQTFGANGFQKRELIIVTEEQYPQTISLDFTQGNCELLNGYQPGQVVKVTFDIRGREWTNPVLQYSQREQKRQLPLFEEGAP